MDYTTQQAAPLIAGVALILALVSTVAVVALVADALSHGGTRRRKRRRR